MQVTLHQGDIEAIFVDSMRESGLEIERSRQPSSLVLSEDEKEIESFDGYPVKVVSFYKYAPLDPTC